MIPVASGDDDAVLVPGDPDAKYHCVTTLEALESVAGELCSAGDRLRHRNDRV